MEAIQNTRDIVLIVVGIVWSLITLVFLAITAVAGVLGVRYLGKAQTFIGEQGDALLGTALALAEQVRERTVALPHYDTALEGARRRRIPAPREPRPREIRITLDLPIPFLRRRKPWYQRLLGQ